MSFTEDFTRMRRLLREAGEAFGVTEAVARCAVAIGERGGVASPASEAVAA